MPQIKRQPRSGWLPIVPLLALSGPYAIGGLSNVGKDWGAERTFYTDTNSRVRVQELTSAEHVADNLYFHFSNFTADNRFLIFVCRLAGSAQLFRAEVETGRLVQLTEGPNTGASSACAHPTDPRLVLYLRGPEVFALDILNFTERKIGE